METLGDLFTLFRTYIAVTDTGYSYLKFYDDLSGGLYCYDDVEIALFDNIPKGCQVLAKLIRQARE